MTAISIDRYMTFVKQELTCINRPWHLRPAWLIVFAWVYGTVQCLPIFHTSEIIPLNNNSAIYYCSTTKGQSLEGTIYLVGSVLLGFVIPLAVLTISYRKIIKVISTIGVVDLLRLQVTYPVPKSQMPSCWKSPEEGFFACW